MKKFAKLLMTRHASAEFPNVCALNQTIGEAFASAVDNTVDKPNVMKIVQWTADMHSNVIVVASLLF